MSVITAAQVVLLIDKSTAGWLALFGSSGSGYGAGDGTFGLSAKAVDLVGLLQGSADSSFADATLESYFNQTALSIGGVTLATGLFSSAWGNAFRAFDTAASGARGVNASISNLDTFMSWYNFGNGVSYWQCMGSPDYYDAYSAVKGGQAPSPHNVYYEVRQGATYKGVTFTNALAKLDTTGPTTTLGVTIDITKYAGGFAYSNTSGLSGSGVLTVTGKDQDGNAETWLGTVTTNGTLLLTPQTRSYSLISQVLTVVAAAGITGGTIYIEAHAPAGRTNPPT